MKKVLISILIGIAALAVVLIVMNYYGQSFQSNRDLGIYKAALEESEKNMATCQADINKAASDNKQWQEANATWQLQVKKLTADIKAMCADGTVKDSEYCAQFK